MGHLAEQNRARAARIRQMTPWERILRAANRGTGLRLSADDVLRLSQDDAIITRAEMDKEGEDDR